MRAISALAGGALLCLPVAVDAAWQGPGYYITIATPETMQAGPRGMIYSDRIVGSDECSQREKALNTARIEDDEDSLAFFSCDQLDKEIPSATPDQIKWLNDHYLKH